ncbi:hypothetical protein [Lacinutrix cladophorae]
MPELISITAIRDAQSLSPKEIDKIGIKSHPENLRSERYTHWLNLCESKEYSQLYLEMDNFLKSEEAIKTYNQITPDLRTIIKFSEYNGYRNFDIKEFAKKVDLRKVKNEFSQAENDCPNDNTPSPFFNLITNFNDQLLAKTQTSVNVKHEFNLQGAIKTLKLIETIYLNKSEKLQLNIEKHYAKPLTINSCIIEIDPCSLLPRVPEIIQENLPNQNDDGEVIEDENKKCRCKEVEQDCECKCNEECIEQNPCCAKITPYIAELFVVRDELCKYEPGEISYIENVMESEIRVRKHRHLQREETYTEQEEDINTYEEKDLQVDQQFSLHKEIDKVVEQSLSVDAGATYSNNSSFGGTTEGGLTIGSSKNFSATLDTSYNWSKKEARKQVQDESKKVISKAISRVEKKIRTLSTKKLLNEIEEKNKHVFGGTTGAEKDMSRQFYYVNQVRKAQVFSYGKRTMLDFYLPEPSELLKRLVEKQFDLKKPVKPCINIEEIGTDKTDWLEFIQCYGFTELEQPPIAKNSEYRYIAVDTNSQDIPDFIVPEGYTATKIEYFSGHANPKDIRFNNKAYIQIVFGSTIIKREWKDSKTTPPQDNLSYTGKVRVKMEEDKCGNDANLTIRITITPDPTDFIPWQLEVHKLLMKKYETELAEYNEALAEFERSKENHFNKNPFILSEIMKEQLKHAAISYITCHFFDENDAMKNKVKDCGFPQMDIPESKREGEFVRFIEQAFEWKFMNYMLYPYFWARKCSWEDKFQEESENYLFTKFLQSGFARVSISVRPGFEGMIDFYLKTRRIWDGGEPPIMGEAFVPIHQEIKESKDNFNADRLGYLTWDTDIDNTLEKNEILLIDNLDYFTEDVDPVTENGLGTYSFDKDKIEVDINREISINCITYRIIDIKYDDTTDSLKFILDRELEMDCCCGGKGKEFDDTYVKKEIPWSTGAEFIGAPWLFKVPTSLTWLREEGGCLPCYPIECKD